MAKVVVSLLAQFDEVYIARDLAKKGLGRALRPNTPLVSTYCMRA
jgi:hypothetical protein